VNPTIAGVTIDGGYAEVMMVDQSATVVIAYSMGNEAAPLLCAGVTTFNALRKAGLEAGALVAVQGVGGLGHLGIQFARNMGFKTVAIGLGPETAALALELGAHCYIDSLTEDAAARLQEMGGASAILATAPSGKAISALVPGLGIRGKLLVVGLTLDPIQVDSFALVSGTRSLSGSLTGTPMEEQETLEFSRMAGVKPMIEIMPLELAAEAYSRMMSAKARFRIVLVTDALEKSRRLDAKLS
jgi:D-arabinose 1-dehydrogenase-like Zn-dependent alcohol dehydrogenase